LALHDHGGSRSLLRIVDGDVVEIVTDLIDDYPPLARALHRGDTTWTSVSRVHDLANRSGADATTVHVYSPPLCDIAMYGLGTVGDFERLREAAGSERSSEDNADNLAFPCPPRLSLVKR